MIKHVVSVCIWNWYQDEKCWSLFKLNEYLLCMCKLCISVMSTWNWLFFHCCHSQLAVFFARLSFVCAFICLSNRLVQVLGFVYSICYFHLNSFPHCTFVFLYWCWCWCWRCRKKATFHTLPCQFILNNCCLLCLHSVYASIALFSFHCDMWCLLAFRAIFLWILFIFRNRWHAASTTITHECRVRI